MPSDSVQHPFLKAVILISIGILLQLVLKLIWRRPAPRSRALIQHRDHILLVSNIPSPWHWTLPGGGYHLNETSAECAAREVREEIGVTIPPTAYKAIGRQEETSHGIPWRYDCVCATIDNRPPLTLSIEIYRAAWFPLDNLPANSSSYIKRLLLSSADE